MSPKIFIKLMLSTLSLVMLFHILIIIKVIPYSITWGGRLKNDSEMYVFEAISLLINSFLIYILLVKGTYLNSGLSQRFMNAMLWLFFALFILNTLGNIFAQTLFEKFFALVTALYAICIWKILRMNLSDRQPR